MEGFLEKIEQDKGTDPEDEDQHPYHNEQQLVEEEDLDKEAQRLAKEEEEASKNPTKQNASANPEKSLVDTHQ